jgi:hypothetical protein
MEKEGWEQKQAIVITVLWMELLPAADVTAPTTAIQCDLAAGTGDLRRWRTAATAHQAAGFRQLWEHARGEEGEASMGQLWPLQTLEVPADVPELKQTSGDGVAGSTGLQSWTGRSCGGSRGSGNGVSSGAVHRYKPGYMWPSIILENLDRYKQDL